MLTPSSLQAYLRAAAARTHDVAEVWPFALFFDPGDPLRFYNYAIPAEPVGDVAQETLAALRAEFARRARVLRFEFIEQYAPDLGSALAAVGLVEEGRNPLLVCTAGTFRPTSAVPGLVLREVTPQSADADLSAWIMTQGRGFAEEDVPEPTEGQVADLCHNLASGSRAFLALLDGMPVAAGMLTAALDGYVELAGIATLPGYRRRGIATALTGAMTETAFAAGLQIAFLSAADEQAGRVYERVGFRPYAIALAYGENDA